MALTSITYHICDNCRDSARKLENGDKIYNEKEGIDSLVHLAYLVFYDGYWSAEELGVEFVDHNCEDSEKCYLRLVN